MKVLVTGGAGFLGRHFVAELERRECDVYSVDLRAMTVDFMPIGRTRLHVIQDMVSFIATLRERFDLIIHCAAWEPHRVAIDGVNMNLARNLRLDAELFRWATETKQGGVLYVSSSAVYPTELQGPDTRHLLGEHDLTHRHPNPDKDYGWQKFVGEILARRAQENGLDVTVVRPFSGYGEDQSLDFPFRAILERARRSDLTVWGPPGQTRDWIHVDDVVRGALEIYDVGHREPINLCTGQGTTMGDLALMFAQHIDPVNAFAHKVTHLLDRPTGVFHRVGDPTRMLEFYTPRVTLEEGVRRAVMAYPGGDNDGK